MEGGREGGGNTGVRRKTDEGIGKYLIWLGGREGGREGDVIRLSLFVVYH